MKLILGSKSPRRKQLLEQLGYSFEVRTRDTDESFDLSIPTESIPVYIAKKKANELLPTLNDDELLLTADTVVVLENDVLGKPKSIKEAKSMLKKLSGKTHRVISGIVLRTKAREYSGSVTTFVTLKKLTTEEINYYTEKYHPLDKAGAYGIQEWIGLIGVTKVEGSYTNVVGLPTAEVNSLLEKFHQKRS